MTEQAFWIAQGDDVFAATIRTQGPWNPQFQHGGPPAGLLVRQLEHCAPRPDMILARISIDILGPVPIATLHAYARVVRPGRSVEQLEAFLEHDGRLVMHASAWRIRLPNVAPPETEHVVAPSSLAQGVEETLAPEWTCGYIESVEWRYTKSGFRQQGPATVWARVRCPLIAGEEISPMQRLITIADSANGISGVLDIREWQYVPPELTLHAQRPPIGEWICMDAVTHIQSAGTGLTTSHLYDEQGIVGRTAQSLFISKRV